MEIKPATPAKKGAIIALLLIILSLGIYFSGQLGNRTLRSVQFVIVFVGILLSSMYYAKQMQGNVTFGNIFAEGFKTTAAVIVLVSIYTIVAMKLVLPGMVDKILDVMRQDAQSQGKEALDYFNANIQNTKASMVTGTVGVTIFTLGITGALAAVVGAALSKKNLKQPQT